MGWEQPNPGWVPDMDTDVGSQRRVLGSSTSPVPRVPTCQVQLSTLPFANQDIPLNLQAATSAQASQLCCVPAAAAFLSQPSRRSWRKTRDRKALVQQFHKSFHSMTIYELDHKLMTVALKKEFLAAEQLAWLSSESIKYAFDTGDCGGFFH